VEVLIFINLAALFVFDLLLRVVRLNVPDILHDLTLGVAYIVAGVWAMHRFGVNLTSIVATSAVVTAVIGLSLQSTLGNVIGGLALQVDDSIREGDWIELDSHTQGQVKKVRWRHTVIETRDWDTLIVPNSQLLGQTIKVLGKREGQPTQHRTWVHFNVDHRYPPGDVIRIVTEALSASSIPGIATHPAPDVVCLDLARDGKDSFGLYAVRYFLVDLERDDPTSSAVRERIHAALRRAQIPLALPAQTLFVNHEDQKAERKREKHGARIRSALRVVPLFSRLSEEEIEILADSAKLAPFVAGEVVTRQGAPANWLYVLVKGEVEVRVATDRGEDRQVAVVKAPGFFGEMALLTGAPREATVVALEDIECLRVDKDDFREVLSRRPELAHEISMLLAQRRVELESVRDNLDAVSRKRRVQTERKRILEAIREFFAMND
ncbi:MAG TPA: mechanosensitive ion channel family protein, partial [Polyangiaceae bacterium]|nr:mechanosensitive ion channel family protein [Polyangiaceae bacterium]